MGEMLLGSFGKPNSVPPKETSRMGTETGTFQAHISQRRTVICLEIERVGVEEYIFPKNGMTLVSLPLSHSLTGGATYPKQSMLLA